MYLERLRVVFYTLLLQLHHTKSDLYRGCPRGQSLSILEDLDIKEPIWFIVIEHGIEDYSYHVWFQKEQNNRFWVRHL